MAYSTVLSAALVGLEVKAIHVEADVSDGLPVFHMIGYLSSEVKEASERVRTAIRNTGIKLQAKKMVVNLAPATVRKRGASYDLPIALALLASLGIYSEERLAGTMVIGELSLDGRVKKVSGVLPIVIKARDMGCHTCILPGENVSEGAIVQNIRILGVNHLKEICQYLQGEKEAPYIHRHQGAVIDCPEKSAIDYSDIQGQTAIKRAVEVAVSGGHNLLLIGPPGSGKSMVARRIPTILPPLTLEESIEITKIYSVLGMVDRNQPLITRRPFRSVHHTVTRSALIGGGNYPAPGEISLAHGGVLFLDELAEFQKPVLEVLRQPLEEHVIRISRNHGNYVFPADFILAAAMNPCPCGNYPDLTRCSCSQGQIHHYLGRISQPFLDRIDICVEVSRIPYETLCGRREEETSADIRERVCAVRKIQRQRYAGMHIVSNAMLNVKELHRFCRLGDREERLMELAFSSLGLTARTYHKILKVARTIADMEGSEDIREPHLKEAIGYRTMDKKYWGR